MESLLEELGKIKTKQNHKQKRIRQHLREKKIVTFRILRKTSKPRMNTFRKEKYQAEKSEDQDRRQSDDMESLLGFGLNKVRRKTRL